MSQQKEQKRDKRGRIHKGGMPEGHVTEKTRSKEEAREALRVIVMREMDDLVAAQIANAKGLSHFFLRDPKTKQFIKIEDAKAIETALNSGDEGSYYWIHTKDPSTQAFSDLMNRALDKPKEQVQEIKLTSDDELLAKLDRVKRLNREKVK